MTNEEKQWAMAWKAAAPKLQAIRDEELRQSRTKGFQYVDESTVVYDPAPQWLGEDAGMVYAVSTASAAIRRYVQAHLTRQRRDG